MPFYLPFRQYYRCGHTIVRRGPRPIWRNGTTVVCVWGVRTVYLCLVFVGVSIFFLQCHPFLYRNGVFNAMRTLSVVVIFFSGSVCQDFGCVVQSVGWLLFRWGGPPLNMFLLCIYKEVFMGDVCFFVFSGLFSTNSCPPRLLWCYSTSIVYPERDLLARAGAYRYRLVYSGSEFGCRFCLFRRGTGVVVYSLYTT